MAPSTPPPPLILRLAALTTASTRCSVMSPSTTEMSMTSANPGNRAGASPATYRSVPGATPERGQRQRSEHGRDQHRPTDRHQSRVLQRPRGGVGGGGAVAPQLPGGLRERGD